MFIDKFIFQWGTFLIHAGFEQVKLSFNFNTTDYTDDYSDLGFTKLTVVPVKICWSNIKKINVLYPLGSKNSLRKETCI